MGGRFLPLVAMVVALRERRSSRRFSVTDNEISVATAQNSDRGERRRHNAERDRASIEHRRITGCADSDAAAAGSERSQAPIELCPCKRRQSRYQEEKRKGKPGSSRSI